MGKVSAKLLVIEDSPTIIWVLQKILRNEYEVHVAKTGEEGIELARKHAPDLILLDVILPGMDGYEVCETLKASSQTKHIPVIFLTGKDEIADEAHGLEVGAIDYVTKPISAPILKARVHNHLELKRHRDLLTRISATDGLTGIPNRRYFDEYILTEWRSASRNQTPLSVVLMDIDFFKPFNDNYGHLVGDDCLKEVAQVLDASLNRPADLAARYGGEEFVAVLPETDANGAWLIADKLRQAVAGLGIPHEYSKVADNVTLSLGVATCIPTVLSTPEELLQAADKSLYKAKMSGRNQVSPKFGVSATATV